MVTAVTILHVLICVFLILVVLLQAGKGGGMGLAFGGSGAASVFGGSGAGNLLTKVTTVVASSFLVTSLILAHFSTPKGSQGLKNFSEQARKEAEREAETLKKYEQPTPPGATPDGSPNLIPISPVDASHTQPTDAAKNTNP